MTAKPAAASTKPRAPRAPFCQSLFSLFRDSWINIGDDTVKINAKRNNRANKRQ
eukprot:CAMPEP_0197321054 /NCGR_PEP_ID=MMETSP0891-20130614/62987_1 /TAXON_ID=44058 ORGANISM="Aureoumbra lagunensis, Strain CCMP1510" /NCGR_SAMPLE_ID=MMETSP0891 /ASSEMBLY_ACC=CAM_ASM_000534 /LENGTH=53 /DNA_ID=CAMNT_0042812721 /DNA_START=1102 /DNA_END=1260 /DNA_ORIENTATION=+